jgi:outer membrane biogenesis lipoprotein LolB
MKPRALLGMLAATLLLSACAEKAQVAATKQRDARPWQGLAAGQAADAGWKAGDQAAWEEQLRMRAQRGQNEYTRAAAQP